MTCRNTTLIHRRGLITGTISSALGISTRASAADAGPVASLSLNERVKQFPKGGKILVPAGETFLTSELSLSANRLQLEGQGANVSLLVHAAKGGNAVKIGNTTVGGTVESAIRDVGFASPNAQTSAAIYLENVSTSIIEKIGIAQGNWPGPRAIGIATSGRELITIQDCNIACARPLVHKKNARHPTIALDHVRVQRNLLFATGQDTACIECEDGVNISTSTYQNLALCGGRDGFLWIDRTSTIASFGLSFRDLRVEQGTSSDGWSINIESGAGLQSLMMENCRLDRGRNGIRLRNVQRITLTNVEFDTPPEDPNCLLDIVGVPGTVLIMINCFAQTKGTIRFKNLKRVLGLDPYVAETAIGGFELWSYIASEADSPHLQIQN